MIQVVEVSKNFGAVKQKADVLDKVSWTVTNGTVAALIGRLGSGKTAALRIIAGIQDPSHGKVELDHQDIMLDPMEARRMIGFVPDTTDQFQGLTGEEYLNFIADIYEIPREDRENCIRNYAPRLKIDLYLKDRMVSYSKSMYKKVMLLGAMIHQPGNLVLDSIFEGMGDGETDTIKRILKEYARMGHAVLFTDSRLRIVENTCDRVIILVSGKVAYEGSIQGLKEKYSDLASLDMIDLMINGDMDRMISGSEGGK